MAPLSGQCDRSVPLMTTTAEKIIEIRIDRDALRAAVCLVRGADVQQLTPALVKASLGERSVVIDADVTARVEEFCRLVGEKEIKPEQPFDLAVGTHPTNATNGAFLSAFAKKETPNAYERWLDNGVHRVKAGDALGTIRPPTDAAAGRDVCGKSIEPTVQTGKPIDIGDGVSCGDDGSLQATVDGRLVVDGMRVCVVSHETIEGDVTIGQDVGELGRDTCITGNIGDGVRLVAKQSLVIDGSIEGARIDVGHDLFVTRGMVGTIGGGLTVGRDLAIKFAEEAEIEAKRHLVAETNLVNCKLRAGACVIAPTATIVGGELTARYRVLARVVGGEACTPTQITVGPGIEVARRAAELEDKLKSVRQLFEKVDVRLKPLQNNVRRLTAAQKEEMTELSFEASQFQETIQEIENERKGLLASLSDGSFIQVSELIQEGVEFVIADRRTKIKRAMHGPVKIQRCKHKGSTELIAHDQKTGRAIVLSSRRID